MDLHSWVDCIELDVIHVDITEMEQMSAQNVNAQ